MTKPIQVRTKKTPEVAPVPEENEDTIDQRIDELKTIISVISLSISENLKQFKTIDQELKRISSAYRKESKRKYRKKNNTSSSHGFNASVSISKQLAEFLNVSPETKLRRPEVTTLISKYANENGLKSPENKGIYLPDEKLKSLFGKEIYPLRSDPSKNGYDMFNLQKYMKPHFEKTL